MRKTNFFSRFFELFPKVILQNDFSNYSNKLLEILFFFIDGPIKI